MSWHVFQESLPLILRGLTVTLLVSIVAMVAAVAVGALLTAGMFLRLHIVRFAAFGAVHVFRALSIYIYILWLYYALTALTGVKIGPFAVAVLSLSCLHGAYLAEIYRSAIRSVGTRQFEAALSLGMVPTTAFVSVVLPQAARFALPPTINQFASLVKDSSLLSLVGLRELTMVNGELITYYSAGFEFYTVAALCYVAIIFVVSLGGNWIERRHHAWMT